MAEIFLSHGRHDTPGYVRALMTEMKHAVGIRQVFPDREDIEAGSNVAGVIEDTLDHCERCCSWPWSPNGSH
jgi:hypothetical protein